MRRQPFEQPIEVIAACVAIGGSSLIACGIDLFSPMNADGKPHVFGALTIAVLAALVIWGLLRRINWLRWVVVAPIGTGLAMMVAIVIRDGTSAFSVMFYWQAVFQAAAAVLLLLPRANQWYASR